MWGFRSIRTLAIERLSTIAGPVDKVVLGHAFDVSHWLPEAYLAVCDRAEPLTIDEGGRLGLKDVVRINAAREAMRTRAVMSVNRVREIVGTKLSVDLPHSSPAPAPRASVGSASHSMACRSLHVDTNSIQEPATCEIPSKKPGIQVRAPAAAKQPFNLDDMRSVALSPLDPDNYVSYFQLAGLFIMTWTTLSFRRRPRTPRRNSVRRERRR